MPGFVSENIFGLCSSLKLCFNIIVGKSFFCKQEDAKDLEWSKFFFKKNIEKCLEKPRIPQFLFREML